MRRLRSTVLLLCAATGACSYATDRLRDAADVLTLTWGLGAGVQPRVGPLTTGLMANAEYGGLRGGCLTRWDGDLNHLFGLVYGAPIWPADECARRRGKALPWMFVQTAWWPYEIEGAKRDSIGVPFTYFTDLELQVGLGLSVRAGFNPAELVDFLLGWVGVDLLADDLGEPFEVTDEVAVERWRRLLNL